MRRIVHGLALFKASVPDVPLWEAVKFVVRYGGHPLLHDRWIGYLMATPERRAGTRADPSPMPAGRLASVGLESDAWRA